jgi:hypothetical protein
MMKSTTIRAGRTAKVSVSLDLKDLAVLRRLARRRHKNNLSAALAEGVRLLREDEGRRALVHWLGKAAETTGEDRHAVRVEWRHGPAAKRRRRVA